MPSWPCAWSTAENLLARAGVGAERVLVTGASGGVGSAVVQLAALRGAMATEGLDGFLVPRADAHQGEYVAPRDERLAWLTGFTGSAGFAAVLPAIAGVFVDGRYRLQVRSQCADVFTPVDWPEVKLADWLKDEAPAGARIGFDPWLHTAGEVDKLGHLYAIGVVGAIGDIG